MRKITNNVTTAFENNRPFKSGNDEVRVSKDSTQMLLHGNLIAEKVKGVLFISNCGWQTNTTKERLNGLNGVRIQQIKGVWYLFDKTGIGRPWDGKRTKVII